jgi:hypothetical protein
VDIDAVEEWYYSNWDKQDNHDLTNSPVAPHQTGESNAVAPNQLWVIESSAVFARTI